MRLSTVWQDPGFDTAEQAFYYLRVLEISTPRWTAYDQKRFNITMGQKYRRRSRSAFIPRPSATFQQRNSLSLLNSRVNLSRDGYRFSSRGGLEGSDQE